MRQSVPFHEGLRDVVVGSCFESGDDIMAVVAGRYHDDRNVALAAHPAAELESAHLGQHQIEQD